MTYCCKPFFRSQAQLQTQTSKSEYCLVDVKRAAFLATVMRGKHTQGEREGEKKN